MEKIFIETLSLFSDNPEDEQISKDYWENYVFSLDLVQGYNKSTLGYATIDLNNGNRYTIAIKYEDFMDIMKDNFTHIKKIDPKAEYEFKEQ